MRMRRIAAFLAMLLGTAAAGLMVGFGLGFLLSRLLGNDFAGWGDLVGASVGMFLGYPLGVFLGQVVAKAALHYAGSLLWGAGGILLGAGLTIGLAEPLNLNVSPDLLLGTFFVLTPLLGTAGYHLRRSR